MARSNTFKGNAIFLGVCLAVVLAAVVFIILSPDSDDPLRASASSPSAETNPTGKRGRGRPAKRRAGSR
jgi:hypothetical protein